MGREHEQYVEDVAPYVLGALAPLEIEALQKHLRVCGECRRELSELRTGAEALSRAVEQVEPPTSLRARILEEIAGEAGVEASVAGAPRSAAPAESGSERVGTLRRLGQRLRRDGFGPSLLPRPAFVAATAAVALVAGVGGWALGGSGAPDAGTPNARTLAGKVDRGRLPEASAQMTVPAEGRDSVLKLAGLRDLGPQRTYELWVQRDGELAPGPTFSPTADGSVVTGIPGESKDIDAVFVTRERAGGALAPTETPIVSVPLSS